MNERPLPQSPSFSWPMPESGHVPGEPQAVQSETRTQARHERNEHAGMRSRIGMSIDALTGVRVGSGGRQPAVDAVRQRHLAADGRRTAPHGTAESLGGRQDKRHSTRT